MTTVKEFEEKIEDILDFMNKSLIIVPSATAKCYLVSDENASILENTIKQLQPPRPTCSNCNYCKNYSMDYDDYYRCSHDKIDWNMMPYIEEPVVFGCIHHSDYEAQNE